MRKPACGWLARSEDAPGAREPFGDPAVEYLVQHWHPKEAEKGTPKEGAQARMEKEGKPQGRRQQNESVGAAAELQGR